MIREYSTRFNIEGLNRHERNNIYIKELAMTWGQSWSALRKTWYRLKLALRNGDYQEIQMLKDRIVVIRTAMGLKNAGDGLY
ncbi:MAG: hypothetical protein WCC17_00235 [Candidatus Nitrosopolaris sp.]